MALALPRVARVDVRKLMTEVLHAAERVLWPTVG